ncbi:MAG: hypothetical protein LOD90_07555, partial [Symbiobacteriaceae bacterium]
MTTALPDALGHFGPFGGRYVPETLMAACIELAEAYHIVGREEDANATALKALEVAQQQNDPDRIATVQRFIAELKNTCSG